MIGLTPRPGKADRKSLISNGLSELLAFANVSAPEEILSWSRQPGYWPMSLRSVDNDNPARKQTIRTRSARFPE